MSRDFTISGEGNIFILTPHTAEAREWVSEKIADDALHFGAGVVVEHRYIVDIAEGIRNDGLSVND